MVKLLPSPFKKCNFWSICFNIYTNELLVNHLLIYRFLLKRNRIIDHYLIPRKSEIKLFSIITTEKKDFRPLTLVPTELEPLPKYDIVSIVNINQY